MHTDLDPLENSRPKFEILVISWKIYSYLST